MSESVYFMRHAQSMFNRYGIDEKNCGITNHGKKQAQQAVINHEFDLIIISPLRRCRETLDNLNIKYKNLIVNHNCREFKTSACDFFEDEEFIKETNEQLQKRISDFRNELALYKKIYNKILVICHGVYVSHFTYGRHRLDNCQMIENTIF